MAAYSWSDLEKFGVIRLTGEACGLNMRIIFDLTPKGKTLVESFLGNTVEIREGSNWNSSDGQVASIMLSRDTACDVLAFAVAMKHEVCIRITGVKEPGYSSTAVCFGLTWEEYKEPGRRKTLDLLWHYHLYHRAGTAGDGSRNRHEFSGRTV